MSHFSKIKTTLRDINTLKMTLADLELNWKTDTNLIQGYNNQKHEADIIIKQEGSNYDIGFFWNGSEFELVSDLQFWEQSYSIESFLDKISQRYAYNLIISESAKKGFQPTQTVNQVDGSIKLVINKWS